MPNWNQTKIYKLICKDLNIIDCYVGSTTNWNKRKIQHRSCCVNSKIKNYYQKKYDYIRKNGGFENFNMILIEEYPCNNSLEARLREKYWQEFYNAQLNMKYAYYNSKEYHKNYYKINCEKLKNYQKEHSKKKYISSINII